MKFPCIRCFPWSKNLDRLIVYSMRYDVGVIADLVNTIAIRQRLKRRLYIYESIKGYCLVMFIKPEIAREIHSVFSIFPDRGTDYYLDH